MKLLLLFFFLLKICKYYNTILYCIVPEYNFELISNETLISKYSMAQCHKIF